MTKFKIFFVKSDIFCLGQETGQQENTSDGDDFGDFTGDVEAQVVEESDQQPEPAEVQAPEPEVETVVKDEPAQQAEDDDDDEFDEFQDFEESNITANEPQPTTEPAEEPVRFGLDFPD